MKRLLLICAGAGAVMLTACIDVSLAHSSKAADGGRVTFISTSSQSESAESNAAEDRAEPSSTPRDDVRLRR